MVTRTVNSATLAATEAGWFHPVVMVYLDWPGSAVRAHSSAGVISFGGHDWAGVGKFGKIEVSEEAVGMAQAGASLILTGAPPELDQYLDAPIRARDAEVWFGVVDGRGSNALIGQPFRIFAGYMDAMRDTITAEDGGITRAIILQIVNGPSQREGVSLFHTDEDQRARFPDDTAGRLFLHAQPRAMTLRWPA